MVRSTCRAWAACTVCSRAQCRLGRVFPKLFVVHVLAGEVPIDQTQRALLRKGAALHPLVRRIVRIHVTEEARHVCFALDHSTPASSITRPATPRPRASSQKG